MDGLDNTLIIFSFANNCGGLQTRWNEYEKGHLDKLTAGLGKKKKRKSEKRERSSAERKSLVVAETEALHISGSESVLNGLARPK